MLRLGQHHHWQRRSSPTFNVMSKSSGNTSSTCTRLEYFTTFQHLEVLKLFILPVDKPFLLKLLDSCPKLKQITVSDWNTLGRRWYLEEVASENLFAAAAKLPSSFEPKISKGENCTQDGLIAYGQATRGYCSFLAVGKAIWRVDGTDCHSTEIIPYFYLD